MSDIDLLFQLEAQLVYTEAQARVRDRLSQVPLHRVRDPRHARAIRQLTVIGIAALPRDQLDRVNLQAIVINTSIAKRYLIAV